MKRRRGNYDSTILQHLRPRDVETVVRALAVGGPATSLMDDDAAGLKSEVAGSDKLHTDAEANAEPDKTSAWITQLRARVVPGCTDYRPAEAVLGNFRRDAKNWERSDSPRLPCPRCLISIPVSTHLVGASDISS
ncbi:hypothetical protein PISMIDRAFT_15255 [Pisolithus microcarpus 441]|uniref:Uncharacterized protein n=1 Tax=Pisolithus microcarpus 441 TaxID=765257 RepID=A0A0C9Z475_9AGAM|nr:hypothetical protein BKA83DRAFT_15255 [Pisolithus microcarpus]KIK17252.1 hypothetical protein PISMIDRAFT_15255 [Pisolithus microcarpus 441]